MATGSAGSGEEVNIKFGASLEGLKGAFSQIGEMFKGVSDSAKSDLQGSAAQAFEVFGKSAKEMADVVISKWNELPPLFQGVAKAVTSVGIAITAGLSAKKLADANAQMVESTRDLARALGITTNEASFLSAALEDVGASEGEYEGAAKGLSRQLKSNEEDMRRFGLVTRDQAGNLRPINDLVLDAIKLINTYKEGTDRNIASQNLFGRGLSASSRLLLLNKETVDLNRQAVIELGLEVGEAAVKGWEDYDAASDRAGLTIKAFGKAIQESVLPSATELTEWFNNTAPAGIKVLRGALSGITTAFLSLTNGVRVVWETINALVITVAEPVRALAEAIYKGATGDFQGAAAAIKGIGGTISGSWEQAFKKIEDSSAATKERIDRVWAFATGGNAKKGDSGASDGDKNAPGKKKESFSADELALAKAKYQAGIDLQLEFLRQQTVINDNDHQQKLISLETYYAEKLKIDQQAMAFSIDAKRKELAELDASEARLKKVIDDKQTGPEERSKAEDQVAKLLVQQETLIGEINKMEEKRMFLSTENKIAKEAEAKALNDQRALTAAAAENDAAQSSVASEKARIDQMKSLRQIDADEEFALQRQQEDRSYAATQRFLEKKRALIAEYDTAGRDALNAEAEAAERQHQARMTQISNEAERERAAGSLQVRQGVQQNFAEMLNGVMSGTKKVSDAFKQFAFSIAVQFQNLIAQNFAQKLFGAGSAGGGIIDSLTGPITNGISKMVSSWVKGQSAMTAATTTNSAARTATEQAAGEQSLLILAAQAIKRIAISAWTAAASVYDSISRIPYVGPFLAPAAAIAAAATVLAFGQRIASAEGGWWQVPGDQIAQIHKNEMVLPAKEAQGVRNLVSGGGSAGGAMNVTIHAMDGASVKRVLMENKGALVDALKSADRDFRK